MKICVLYCPYKSYMEALLWLPLQKLHNSAILPITFLLTESNSDLCCNCMFVIGVFNRRTVSQLCGFFIAGRCEK